MVSRELIKKVRRIEIRTKRVVHDQMAGQYHSVFKGRGMAFEEVREYSPGDDVRLIDWNVTARSDAPFIKIFAEERELTVMLLVDMSRSRIFGTRSQSKAELMAELAALLAFSAIANNDRVGLIITTNDVERFVPPKKGRKHVLRVVSEILTYEPKERGSDLASGLRFLNTAQRHGAIVFQLSDFLSPLSGYEGPLKIAARKHDLIGIRVHDRWERELPDVGLMHLADAESGDPLWVDSSSPKVRSWFADKMRGLAEERERIFRRYNIDYADFEAGEDYERDLVSLFRRRALRQAA